MVTPRITAYLLAIDMCPTDVDSFGIDCIISRPRWSKTSLSGLLEEFGAFD